MRAGRLFLALLIALLPLLGLAQGPGISKADADRNYAKRYPVAAADVSRSAVAAVSPFSATLSGATGTLFSSYTPQVGGTITRSSTGTSGGSNMVLDGNGGVRQDGATGFTIYTFLAQSNPDYEINGSVVFYSTANTQCYFIARRTSSSYYAARYNATANTWDIARYNTTPTVISNTFSDPITVSGSPVTRTVRFVVSGASLQLFVNGTLRCTAYDTRLALGGVPGVGIFDGTLATDSTRGHIGGTLTVSSTLSSGAVYQTASTASSITLGGSAATGGTSPTYQWYRSTSKDTKGSAVSGATSATLTDTGRSPGTLYFYTRDASSGGLTVSSPQATASTLRVPILSFSILGDSKSAGALTSNAGTKNPGIVAKGLIATALGIPTTSIAFTNQAVSGTTTTDWAFTDNASHNGANLVAACDAMLAQVPPATHCLVTLGGVNDSKPGAQASTATFKSNMATILAYMVSRGITPIVCCESIIEPERYSNTLNLWDPTSLTALDGYYNALPSLCNGYTILLGDMDYRPYSTKNAHGLVDGVHEGDAMSAAWAQFLANAYLRVVGGLRMTEVPATTVNLVTLASLRRDRYDLSDPLVAYRSLVTAIDDRKRLVLR